MPSRSAFSLIESLLALGLLSVGALTLLALVPASLHPTWQSALQEKETRLLLEIARLADQEGLSNALPIALDFDESGALSAVPEDELARGWRVELTWETRQPRTLWVRLRARPAEGAPLGPERHYHLIVPPP